MTETGNTAAVETAGRALMMSALPRNPFTVVATALIGPILALFRTPAAPPPTPGPAVTKIRYRYRTIPAPGRDRSTIEASSKDDRRTIEEGRGKSPTIRASASSRCVTHLKLGGHSHG